ncbi:hypothetical protein [Psychrobacillus sp. MER TA 171]|uniref:hypothetical protein n=1 Tax=Psychrobacillus sp. MER TA 171 TaxID=2939577 RepID=UPI002040D3FA|nr:hypothetical protein [Psychrobacillus sp. MER TA 171]MCM3358671.1 hypothetical protein [Psychrobacillus sp. MER TA 171]
MVLGTSVKGRNGICFNTAITIVFGYIEKRREISCRELREGAWIVEEWTSYKKKGLLKTAREQDKEIQKKVKEALKTIGKNNEKHEKNDDKKPL